MAVSAVTMAELACGPEATSDPQERARRIAPLQHAEDTAVIVCLKQLGAKFAGRDLRVAGNRLVCAGLKMRQSGRYSNGPAGVEGFVEMLLEPVDRRLRQKLLDPTRQVVTHVTLRSATLAAS